MPRKTPIGKIKDAALGTIKDPVGAAGKAAGRAVGQARDSVALGRTVADHVTRGASEAVLSRLPLPGRDEQPAPAARPRPAPTPERAVPAEAPLKDQGDALATSAPSQPTPVAKPAAKKAPAKTAPAKKAPATRTAAKKAPAATPVTKPAVKPAAKKAPAKKAPAKKAAPTNAIDAAADVEHVDVTPADVAKSVAKKAPATKAAVKKAPAKKAPAKKAAAPGDRLPPRKAAKKAPLTAAELAAGAGTETITPVGTRGADVATNPATGETDLQQPGTEPLVDPSLTKAVAKETETLAKASDPDKG